jgi:hypothetical protein
VRIGKHQSDKFPIQNGLKQEHALSPLLFQFALEYTEALLDAIKEIGLEVNPEKTKYMLMSRIQKVGQKHSIKIANRSSEDVAKFKYLGKTPTSKLHARRD